MLKHRKGFFVVDFIENVNYFISKINFLENQKKKTKSVFFIDLRRGNCFFFLPHCNKIIKINRVFRSSECLREPLVHEIETTSSEDSLDENKNWRRKKSANKILTDFP